MKFRDFASFFPQTIHNTRGNRRPLLKMENAQWQTLPEDTCIFGFEYAKDSQFKVFETLDFGWIVFHPSTRTPDGKVPGRLILKY